MPFSVISPPVACTLSEAIDEMICVSVRPYASSLFGSTSMWYSISLPPLTDTWPTPAILSISGEMVFSPSIFSSSSDITSLVSESVRAEEAPIESRRKYCGVSVHVGRRRERIVIIELRSRSESSRSVP